MRHTADRVERVFEFGDHAERPAASGQGPQEVGLHLRARPPDQPVGGDDLHRAQLVDRRTIPSHQPSEPAAERDPRDPDRSGITERDCEPVCVDGGRELARGEPGARYHGPRTGVDGDAPEE